MIDKDIIKRPILTEKTTKLKEENKYVFEVSPKATKTHIKSVIEELFKVNVVDVRTMHKRGKPRRVRFRIGRRKNIKKAIVTLKEGQSISLFEV